MKQLRNRVVSSPIVAPKKPVGVRKNTKAPPAATAPKSKKGKGEAKQAGPATTKAKGKGKARASSEDEHEDDNNDYEMEPAEEAEVITGAEAEAEEERAITPQPSAIDHMAVAQEVLRRINAPLNNDPLAASAREDFAFIQDHIEEVTAGPSRKRTRADSVSDSSTRSSKLSRTGATPAFPNFEIEIQPPFHRQSHHSSPPRHEPLKWGRYLLPPFGQPFWRRHKKTKIPVLILPIAVSLDEEVRTMRELADQDPERYEGEYQEFIRGLPDREYRGLEGGSQGEVEDEFERENEANERRRRHHDGKVFDEDYDATTSSGENETNEPEEQTGRNQNLTKSESPSLPPSPSPPSSPHLPSQSDEESTDPESYNSPKKGTFKSRHPLYEPMPYDVPKGVSTRGFFELGDEVKIGVNNAEFIRSYHGYEEGWVGRKFLGQGGEGCAGMWEKTGSEGNVLDQVCIKQMKTSTWEDYEWDKPREVKIMEDLRDSANNGTVQLLGYRRYPRSRAHRIYMEYCEYGSLEQLIGRYRSKRQWIPEEFIWDTFYHLANACRTMDRGPSQPKGQEEHIYIHRDIKPDNIFLAAPGRYDQDCTPAYPTAKLGDFGQARVTWDDDPYNPSELKGHGTHGYKPPEQKYPAHVQDNWVEEDQHHRDDFVYAEITDDSPKFSSESNVWGVGACIYKLIWLTDASYDFHMKMEKNEEVMPKIKTTRTPEYSQELRDLVLECLNFRPPKRPSPNALLDRVGRARARFREQWKKTLHLPRESLLSYTGEALENMGYGTWRKQRHVPEDTPPPRYSNLPDHNSDL